MDATKSILLSKGVWGALAALIASLVAVKLQLDAKQQADMVQTLTALFTALASSVALYGRITAKHTLTLTGAASVVTKE